MSLLRFVARSMLASYFVMNGVKALRHPEEFVVAAEPVAEKVLPLANSTLPESVRGYLPEDTTGFVRLTGALQVAGGLSLATGLGRRIGAGILALTMLPNVATNPLKPAGTRTGTGTPLNQNVALLGGVLLAARDTEGKPNLIWQVRTRKELLGKEAAKRKAELERNAVATAAGAAKVARRSVRKARRTVEGVLS